LSPLGAGPQQGSINTPVSAPPVIAPSGDQERAMAEQQQRMADQERRIADQNNQMAELSRLVQEGSQSSQQASGPDPAQQRKLDEQQRQIADQTRQMAEMSRRMDEESRSSRDSRDSDGQNERKLDEQSRLISDQNRRMSDLDRKLDDQSKSSDVDKKGNDAERDQREADQIRENLDLRRQIEVADRPPREVISEPETPRQAPRQREPEILERQPDRSDQAPDLEEPTEYPNVQYQDDGFDEIQIIEQPRRPEGRREAIVSRPRDQRVEGGHGVEGPRDKKRSPSRPERDGEREAWPVTTGSNDIVRNRRWEAVNDKQKEQYPSEGGSHVYDQYQQLFEATGGAGGLDDNAEGSAPLDVNLLASLVRWVSLAKGRVGDARLKTILDLYLGSGRSSPQLRELLFSISNMVDTVSPETPHAAQECMDLLSHLHGILTGGLQIARMPQITLSE